jgi:Aerotolerance regulator N-terminal
MRFLAPGYLHLAWLLVLPVALYLYRRQARRVQVSTLLFFKVLAREHQESAWLRQLKRWLSLLLTLLIFLMLMLALARPVWSGIEEQGELVLVVDRSASMEAKDADGETRLEAGVKAVRGRLSGVPETVPVTVVAGDARGEVLLAKSRSRRECLRVLGAMETRPVEGDREAVWRVARRLQGQEAGSAVWWVTDDGGETVPEGGEKVEWMEVGLTEGMNVGITGFQVRALPLERERLEGFLQVSAASGNPGVVAAKVEVMVGGRLAHLRELELEPGKAVALSLPIVGGRGQSLEARVTAEGDCLSWDDGVVAKLPGRQPLRVAWYAKEADPFTELAFQSMVDAGRVEMLRGNLAAFPPAEAPDVYVFENWLPEVWPDEQSVIALRPPRSLGPLKVKALPGGGVPHSRIRVVSREHPVLNRVTASRLALTQSCVLEPGGGLESLWMAGNEVLLAAGEVSETQRVVVGAFTPARSEQLAMLPAFPLLLGNALYWCAEETALRRGLAVARTGEMLEMGGKTEWTWWDGASFQTGSKTESGWMEANQIGAWEADDGRSGVTLLASAKETDVPFGDVGAAMNSPEIEGRTTAVQRVGWTVVKWLLAGLLGLLLVESFLFHRRAVY